MKKILFILLLIIPFIGFGQLHFLEDLQTTNLYGRFTTFDLNSSSITSQIIIDSTGYYIDSDGKSTYDPINKIMYVISHSEIISIDVTNGSTNVVYSGPVDCKFVEYDDDKLYFLEDLQTTNLYGRFTTFDLNSSSITSQIIIDSTGYYIDSDGKSTYDPINKIMYVISHSEIISIDVTNGSTNVVYNGPVDCKFVECEFNISTSNNYLTIQSNKRKIIKIVDILGRETKPQPNTPFIEIYNDGSTEKKIVVE